MSGKLDQSLDEILSTRRRSAGARRRSQRQSAGRPATTAPVGGVQKSSRAARAVVNKPTPAKATPHTGESKIIVNNLVSLERYQALHMTPAQTDTPQPKDVNEQQIKVCRR